MYASIGQRNEPTKNPDARATIPADGGSAFPCFRQQTARPTNQKAPDSRRRARPLRGPPAGRDRADGEEMSGIRKSTDAGLTNAERKSLRESEAREAMSDHNDAAKAFHDKRERLRTARLAREAVAGPVLYPAQGLPDDTSIG